MAKIDESKDLDLVERLLFKPHGLTVTPFAQAELLTGRTPDFKVFRAGYQVAYCEVKSPRDDWLDDQLDAAPPGTIVGGGRHDPTFNRLARHIQKAATQFEAVDPKRQFPAILAFVNHDEHSGFADLMEVLTGYFQTDKGSAIATMMDIAQGRLKEVKFKIDLYYD
jgi:hypothetical protein